MMKHLTILVICLIAFSASQTCGEGQIKHMQTGLIELGLPTASFAQKQYTVTFKRDLGVYAQVFHAFALAGFQGSCTQDYYSLVVDRVYIQNRNTKMRFEMDYNYGINSTNYVSQWTKVKLTWIVVTNQFQSYNSLAGGSYVWAGSVDISVNNSGTVALFGQSSIFNNMTDQSANSCGYLSKNANNLFPKFDIKCVAADQIVAHYYIAGFKFNPANSTNKLAASVLFTDYATNGNKAIFSQSTSVGYGPLVTLNNYGGGLKRIKISVVLTTLKTFATYPTTNSQLFGYSGVYMPIDLKNQNRPIVKGTYNKQKFDLPKLTHQIWGISSFTIAKFDQCSSLDVNMNIKDFYTAIVQTDNTDNLTNLFISADFYSKNTIGLCSGSTGASRKMNQISSSIARTVPDLKIQEQNIQQTSTNPTTWKLIGNRVQNGSKFITYNVTMNYENFTIGNAYQFNVQLKSAMGTSPSFLSFVNSFSGITDQRFIRFTMQIDNQIVYDRNLNTTADLALNIVERKFGLMIQKRNPVIRFTLTLPRPVSATNAFIAQVVLSIQQYTTVYNPVTDCCLDKCPLGSAINLISSPPSCTICQGDSSLIFNSNTGVCDCKSGFYNALSETDGKLVCFPCLASLCDKCATTPSTCSSCVPGASLDVNNVCRCLTGFYQTNNTCTSCPAKCLTCSVSGVCNTCSQSNRILDQNCACPAGLYDDGTSTCKICNPICKTCNSSTTCTSCFTQLNRTLINGQCVCSSGFYQVINTNNTVSCRKCNPECKQCSSLNICVDCNTNQNRISGYDEFGRQTCLCKPGYSALKDGTCVESGCTADPYCQTCDRSRNITVCIQCISTLRRVLAVPQYKCVCQQGTYQNQGQCVNCPDGCAKCSNATICQVCAVLAIRNTSSTCSCPDSYFFTTQPLRFCKKCSNYCLRCTSSNSCDQCQPGFSATTNGQCICSRGKYIDSNQQCVSCQSNCATCAGQNNCTLCASGFYVQNGTCVTRCAPSFYVSAVTCEKCQEGCSYCERVGACLVCDAGRYSYNGLCYINCPAGSVPDTTNNTCTTCNSPCKTCVQHPSKCLSCIPGLFMFQNTCRSSCPVGTFNNNGICEYCDFDCLTCVGSKSICTSCPSNKFMFQGNCYTTCPVALVNGKCPNICPNGYYTQGNSCLKCNSQCITCKDNTDYCMSCVSGVANNGVCVQSCPSNKINLNGNCISCAQGCSTCSGQPDSCVNCLSGFFLTGNKCVASCAPDSYRDINAGCQKCNSTCKTCTSANFCTSCADSRSQPINGLCYSCIYPCSTCSDYDKCTSCLAGFSLYDGRCVASCPRGTVIVNGVCKCTSGFLQNGACVTNCASGFTNINDNCVQCSSQCLQCSSNINTCTSCKNGFMLNAVTGKCQINTNCQYGQYYSTEDRRCKRICPTGTSFQDSVCLTECLQGYVYNSFGGCVQQGILSGCSYPYFYQQGVCVSTCVAGSFPNSASRVCQPCSSNCFSCLSSAFCLSCRSGFDLNNGICLSGQRCTENKLKYNGICIDTCPIGTLAINGYCERRCDPNFYFFNGRCYSICPSNLPYRTDVACVLSCPFGFILDGKVCKLNSQSCPSGQFYNTQNGICSACASGCSECTYTSGYCTTCPSGTVLSDNKCVESNVCGSGRFRQFNGQCANCPVKCSQCISATECSTCASGYLFNGYDCVVRLTNLKPIQMTQSAISRRNNTVFISVRLSIIPNGLSNDQKNKFFIVIPSNNDKILVVNQWLSQSQPNTVVIAIQYQTFPQSSTVFLALNAAILSSSFANVGFTANQNSFLTVPVISGSISSAPLTLAIPMTATNSVAGTARDILAAQQTLKKALKDRENARLN